MVDAEDGNVQTQISTSKFQMTLTSAGTAIF